MADVKVEVNPCETETGILTNTTDATPLTRVVTESGVAQIKQEYIVQDHERHIALNCISEEDKLKLGEIKPEDPRDDEPADVSSCKKPRLNNDQKRKLSGQNKSRPIPYRIDREKSLCLSYADIGVDVDQSTSPVTCSNGKCTFLHNVQKYLSIKPPDIGPLCYVFSLQGHCPRGLTCRFASQHITSEGRNIVDKDQNEKYIKTGPTTVNTLKKEMQFSLRKWKYDFSKSEKIVAQVDKEREELKLKNAAAGVKDVNGVVKPEGEENAESVDMKVPEEGNEKDVAEEKNVGPVSDQDIITLRPAEKIVIDWRDKLYLSPLTTVGNLPFRRVCKELGADITCGEMAMSNSLLRGFNQEWALVKRHVSEDIFGVQLCGNNPYAMTKCAQMIEEQCDVNFIDINLGCPIELVYRRGEGSGMLNRDRILSTVIQSMSRVLTVPLTTKMRTGLQTTKSIAHLLAPRFRDWGVSLITVHGRSREQRYTKSANWQYIEQCAVSCAPTPMFLNGDILSHADYVLARTVSPTVAGCMVGRGALIKPWIFTEIKEQRDWDISSAERLDLLKKYVNYGLEHWGSDTKGVENTRRFLLEWLSFLHRYIPVGLLEFPPQRINERPPYYRGRDELETLMASPNCADWLKISELLLGPVPSDYQFLPKHKANSWK